MNVPFTGHDTQANLTLILHAVTSVADVPNAFDSDGPYFVTMLIWDASSATDPEVTQLSRKLIDAGCAYLCCWGDDCERVHDLFDSEWIANGFDDLSDDTIMTTWHTDDSLDEFIYFSLLHTEPTQKYQNDCRSVVALVIDAAEHASRIQGVFADPTRLHADHDG